MTNISDLNIESELLPLLNYTNNKYAEQALLKILYTPINRLEEIKERQSILKLFLQKIKIKNNEHYYPTDILEVYAFLMNGEFNSYFQHPNKLFLKIRFSQLFRQKVKSKFIQVISLLNKLEKELMHMPLLAFPENYQKELKAMLSYLGSFKNDNFETSLQSYKITSKTLIQFLFHIKEHLESRKTEQFWSFFFKYEALLSLSIAANRNNFSFPIFNSSSFKIHDFYHPSISNPVKNSIEIANTVSLITGPNMSGKSTFLKSIGICIYLANIGLAVPAKYCEIPYFNSIFIHINHSDDLKNGYSHFMTELMNLKRVVIDANTNNNCFAIFDELFNGTNHDDALEITKTTIKGLSKYLGSYFLISTHKRQLKEVIVNNYQHADIFYLDCSVNNNVPIFTYQLKRGWSDLNLGRVLFENEGLNNLLA